EGCAILLLKSDNIPRELGVDKQSFLSCCGMSSHEGVDRSNPSQSFLQLSRPPHLRDRVAAINASTVLGCSGLLIARVDGLKSCETLLESRREPFICLGHVAEE